MRRFLCLTSVGLWLATMAMQTASAEPLAKLTVTERGVHVVRAWDLERAGVRSFAYLPRLPGASRPVDSSGLRCEPVGQHRGERIPGVFDVALYHCRFQPVGKS